MNPIEKIEKAIENIECEGLAWNLTSGGCGVFAAAVAYELDRLNVPVQIRMANDYRCMPNIHYARKNNARSMEEWNDLAGDSLNGHVVVEFQYKGKAWYADSSGIFPANGQVPSFEYMSFLSEPLTPRELYPMIREQEGWNDSFDWKDRPRVWSAVRKAFRLT